MKFNRTLLATCVCAFSISGNVLAQQSPNFDFSPQSSSQSNSPQSSSQQPPNTVVKEVYDFEYPDIPAKLNAMDKELMLYEDEKMGIESKERLMLLDLYEREQLRAIRSALDRISRQDAVKDAYGQVSELPPEEIENLRWYKQKITKAKNEPLEEVDQIIDSQEVNLSSNKPIDVYLSSGNQATIVFYDRGGNPWPIEGEPHYDTSAFTISTTHSKNHVALFTLKRPFAESNAVVNLKGLDMPLVIRLIGNESKVHSRLSLRMPSFGPGMKAQPTVYNMVGNASPEMMKVLNGDSIEGSLEYDIEGIDDADAYYKNGMLYVRTKALLLVPPPKEASSLPGGFNSYVVPAKRDLLFSVDGRYVEAHVKKRETINIEPKKTLFERQE